MDFKPMAVVSLAANLIFLGSATIALSTETARAEQKTDKVANSVVEIFSTVSQPYPFEPWHKAPTTQEAGTGVVIEGNRILTCAHVVLYASRVEIQADQSGDKLSATVEAIAPGIDLAVLKLDDDSFFAKHPPLARANILPEIKDVVMAYGYPIGGNSLSITKGIVSRIEFTQYNAPVTGLRIQVDTPINPGNSGGPAVAGDKMIGLAFSGLGGSQNISYIIPCEEIELFLKDIADGKYHGKPALFDNLQTLENPALRSFLRLAKDTTGIVVNKPYAPDATNSLKRWDLITQIGSVPVDNQGMIKQDNNLRVHFTYMVQKIAKNGTVPLTVIRAGKELHLNVPVSPNYPMIIRDLAGKYPSYFIYGPMVFSHATKQYVNAYGGGNETLNYLNWLNSMGSPLAARMYDKPAFEGEELVVITTPFFPHKLAKGYNSAHGNVIKKVNGIKINNLKHLVEVLRDIKSDFVEFEYDCLAGETPVFLCKEMVAETEKMLTDNGIRSQGSPDMMAVWNAKPMR